ncbi:MAG TPA: SDR family oxidoreductase [Beijerinckiaceae bacterium]|nr:SDR family oxidoreductase [Beijerinckiaceae bacterium]
MAGNGSHRPVAVVTGGSAGVGRAVAAAFARRGWRVAVIARGPERLASAAREIERLGGEALPIEADVADADTVFAAADRVVRRWGALDVWVNNAMATIFAPIAKVTPAEFRRVTEVTYLGQVHGTLAALRHMRPARAGTIVQIGSALAYRSIPLQAAYCAAKAAARGFTDSLRTELIHEDSPIRVTMVHLPAVNTPQFDWSRSRMPRAAQPVPPIHDPEPVAEAVFDAAMDAPREVWIGKPTWEAILGQMVAPGWLDGMMARDAWDGQMTDEPGGDRDGNLFAPVPGDHGAHGRFDDRSHPSVTALSSAAVRGSLLAAGLALGLGAVAGAAALGRHRRERIGQRPP